MEQVYTPHFRVCLLDAYINHVTFMSGQLTGNFSRALTKGTDTVVDRRQNAGAPSNLNNNRPQERQQQQQQSVVAPSNMNTNKPQEWQQRLPQQQQRKQQQQQSAVAPSDSNGNKPQERQQRQQQQQQQKSRGALLNLDNNKPQERHQPRRAGVGKSQEPVQTKRWHERQLDQQMANKKKKQRNQVLRRDYLMSLNLNTIIYKKAKSPERAEGKRSEVIDLCLNDTDEADHWRRSEVVSDCSDSNSNSSAYNTEDDSSSVRRKSAVQEVLEYEGRMVGPFTSFPSDEATSSSSSNSSSSSSSSCSGRWTRHAPSVQSLSGFQRVSEVALPKAANIKNTGTVLLDGCSSDDVDALNKSLPPFSSSAVGMRSSNSSISTDIAAKRLKEKVTIGMGRLLKRKEDFSDDEASENSTRKLAKSTRATEDGDGDECRPTWFIDVGKSNTDFFIDLTDSSPDHSPTHIDVADRPPLGPEGQFHRRPLVEGPFTGARTGAYSGPFSSS
jgi:hypothetical protein